MCSNRKAACHFYTTSTTHTLHGDALEFVDVERLFGERLVALVEVIWDFVDVPSALHEKNCNTYLDICLICNAHVFHGLVILQMLGVFSVSV